MSVDLEIVLIQLIPMWGESTHVLSSLEDLEVAVAPAKHMQIHGEAAGPRILTARHRLRCRSYWMLRAPRRRQDPDRCGWLYIRSYIVCIPHSFVTQPETRHLCALHRVLAHPKIATDLKGMDFWKVDGGQSIMA